MTHVVLPRPDDLVLRVIQKLVPVGQPANSSGDHEQDWEHVSRESQSLVDDATVEIDIGVQFPLDEEGVAEGNSFQLHCDFDQLFLANNFEHLIGNLLNDFGPGIVVFVNPVSETIEQTLSVLDIINKFGYIFFFANLLQHSQDSLVGSSMLGPIKCSSGSCDRSVDVNSGGREMPDSSSGAVKFVLNMEDK